MRELALAARQRRQRRACPAPRRSARRRTGATCTMRPSCPTARIIGNHLDAALRCARLQIGTSASGSLAEIAMASTCWSIRDWMTSIWPSAVVDGRAREDDLHIADLLGGFLGALVNGHKEAVAERFGHQADADFIGGARRQRQARRQGSSTRVLRAVVLIKPLRSMIIPPLFVPTFLPSFRRSLLTSIAYATCKILFQPDRPRPPRRRPRPFRSLPRAASRDPPGPHRYP